MTVPRGRPREFGATLRAVRFRRRPRLLSLVP